MYVASVPYGLIVLNDNIGAGSLLLYLMIIYFLLSYEVVAIIRTIGILKKTISSITLLVLIMLHKLVVILLIVMDISDIATALLYI